MDKSSDQIPEFILSKHKSKVVVLNVVTITRIKGQTVKKNKNNYKERKP